MVVATMTNSVMMRKQQSLTSLAASSAAMMSATMMQTKLIQGNNSTGGSGTSRRDRRARSAERLGSQISSQMGKHHRTNGSSTHKSNEMGATTTATMTGNHSSGGSTGDLSSEGCLSRSSSSKPDELLDHHHHHFDYQLDATTTTTGVTIDDSSSSGIGGSTAPVSKTSSPASVAKSASMSPLVDLAGLVVELGEATPHALLGHHSAHDDSEDSDAESNRRRTIVFQRHSDDDVDDDLGDDDDDDDDDRDKMVRKTSSKLASLSTKSEAQERVASNMAAESATSEAASTTMVGAPEAAGCTVAASVSTTHRGGSHHVRSSSYLEVASLSSVYSNYSQFDFVGRSGAVSPPPTTQPTTGTVATPSTSNSQHSSSSSYVQPVIGVGVQQQQHQLLSSSSSTKSSSNSGFTFLGLFGNKNKCPSTSDQNQHQQTPQQHQHQQQLQSSQKSSTSTNSKFDIITSKLFSLNKSSSGSSGGGPLSKTNPVSQQQQPPPLFSSASVSSSSASCSFSSSSTPSTPCSPSAFATSPPSLTGDVTHAHHPVSNATTTSILSASNNNNLSTTSHKSTMSSSNSLASINEAYCFNSNIQVPNTVLIFENRPSNLPAKSQQEAQKHRLEYERMVEIAKKKELKEKEMKIRNYQQQIRKEDFMTNSLRIWNTEILINWDEQKNSRRTNQLWWHGLPPPIRGKVWKLAIGNELNLTEESYYFYEKKAKMKLDALSKNNSSHNGAATADQMQNDASSVELIKLDVSRTFPQLCFFQKDGPYHQPLHDVLGAYACYNTKIGYVQGMSFLTAILLLNMEAPDAFVCLANLLNNKYLLACFCMDQKKMNRYFRIHQILLEYNIPKLYAHFEEQKVKPDLYLIDWIFTLFSKSLPLDVMSRVWDVFFRDQEEFLFRTALGILNLYKDTLLELDFIHIVQFLTKLPDNINATQLFKSIEQIETNVDDAYFSFKSLIEECHS